MLESLSLRAVEGRQELPRARPAERRVPIDLALHALGDGFERFGVRVATVLLISLNAVVNAVAYHDLQVAKEGIGSEELAAIFD